MNEKQRETCNWPKRKEINEETSERERKKEKTREDEQKKMGRARERDRQIHTNVMYVE